MAVSTADTVAALNGEPFNKAFTLISFDALDRMALLKLLNDVISEVDSHNELHKIDLADEEPEETVKRLLGFLRVIKYKPPTEEGFQNSLIAGEKEVVHHVLGYVTLKQKVHRTRAYLARYLVKVHVPPEILQEEEVSRVHEKYNALLEAFTEAHREVKELRSSGFSGDEIKHDISMMEREIETLTKRTERMRSKSKGFPKFQEMLAAAQKLRQEQERAEEIRVQGEDQRVQLERANEKHQREVQHLKQARNANVSGGADMLLRRAEEDHQSAKYISTEKLPGSLETHKKRLAELQDVVNQPSMFQDDLDELHKEIKSISSEIQGLIEKRMVSDQGEDSRLQIYKVQAASIARKKESKSDELRDAEEGLKAAEADIKDKTAQSKVRGPKLLDKAGFKAYLSKLRDKTMSYKEKKREQGELRSEYLILQKTLEMLEAEQKMTASQVQEVEARAGVSGYMDTRKGLEAVAHDASAADEQKKEALEDHAELVKELTKSIAQKKTTLAPMITQLREARTKAEKLERTYTEKKAAYDKEQSTQSASISKVETEVRSYREEVHAYESRFHLLSNKIRILQIQEDRIREERQAYVSKVGPDGKKKPQLRDSYAKKHREQLNFGKILAEKKKMIHTTHDQNMKQLDMWRDLSELMECKAAVSAKEAAGVDASTMEEDRLVL